MRTAGWRVWWGGAGFSKVGGAGLLLLLVMLVQSEAVNLISYLPRSGPVSGGTLITVTGEDFVLTGSRRSKCNFQKLDGRASSISLINIIHNTTHLTCTLPDIQFFFTPSQLPQEGMLVHLSITGQSGQSAPADFLVYHLPSILLTSISPNQDLTNATNGTRVSMSGQRFVDTGEVTCRLDSQNTTLVPAEFVSSSRLDCTLPSVRVPARINVTVSLNGQSVAAVLSLAGTRTITFYSPAPRITASYFSPSYSEILLQFDREVEIGPEEAAVVTTSPVPSDDVANLQVSCSQVFGSAALRVLGGAASCLWQNTQQRVMLVRLSRESAVMEHTVLAINSNSIRTRHVLYSRLASGSVTITSQPGYQLVPLPVLEVSMQIPMCGGLVINGEKSLYGGAVGLEYEWTVGMESDDLGISIRNQLMQGEYLPAGFTGQSRIRIPSSVFYTSSMSESSGSGSLGVESDSELFPPASYYVQLVARSYLGLTSTTILHDVTTTRSMAPAVVIIGEKVRTVQPWREIILEGKVLRENEANCATTESRVSRYSWSISDEGLGTGSTDIKTNTSVLILPPETLMPGTTYQVNLTVTFVSGQSSSACVEVGSEEGVEAWLVGGVRRSVGSDQTLILDGSDSLIHLHPNTQLNVTWGCNSVPVPEVPEDSSLLCGSFTDSDNLTLSIPGGSLTPGGYNFTLTLTFDQNGTLVESSATQLVVLVSHPSPPNIRITSFHANPFLVHRKLFVEAEVASLNPGTVQWSTEYVPGYGQLSLQANITDSPLQYSVCSSLQDCPFTEAGSNLYVAGVRTQPALNSPLVNKITLVLQASKLLPWNSYRFKLSMVDSLGQSGFAEVDTHTESPPVSGRVEIEPGNGSHLVTLFTLRALDWTEERGDGPLAYRLGFQHQSVNGSGDTCVEWMTGISQDNEFSFTLPSIESELHPTLLLQIFDRNGAVQSFTRSFSLIVNSDLPVNFSSDLDSLLDGIGSTVANGYWIEGLARLTALVTSIAMDHESIICSDLQTAQLSPMFQLSNTEFANLKRRALRTTLFLYESFVPLSQSYHQVIISLLQKLSRLRCDSASSGNNPSQLQQMDTGQLLLLLESVVTSATRFHEFGELSRRGISREDTKAVLSTYRQVIHASASAGGEDSPIPRINLTNIAGSFTRILPQIGYALCQRQSIFQDSTIIDLDAFLNVKSSLSNLPPDYTTVVCPREGCVLNSDPVMVDFGDELFSMFLQHPCSPDGGTERSCSGVCLSSVQLYINLLWRGNEFGSLVKTPILHLSLLHPSNGSAVSTSPNSTILLSFPLVAQYSSLDNLYCVIWEKSRRAWASMFCDTLMVPPLVRCQCSAIGSFFYTVLERCQDGYYGNMCNQTCPEGLWGPECRMWCACSNRGTCSPVNGSCDCDPGWEGINCQDSCVEGSYGKLCGETCSCQNGATCDHVTGECSCTPGWIGDSCNISCSEGFYGIGCESSCQCRNASECHFATGSCTCQAGFAGLTCHEACPDGLYGLACALTCQCFDSGTRSCDPISGSCDCNDLWMGELCDEAPTEPPPFPVQWVILGLLVAIIAAGATAIVIVVVVIWRKKKRKRNSKIFPVPVEATDDKGSRDKDDHDGSSNGSLFMLQAQSQDVLVPQGMDLKDVFLSSSAVSKTGNVTEFEEPPKLAGKLRWQIIQILSEGGSEGRKSSSLADRMILESRDSSRPTSKALGTNKSDGSDNEDTQSQDQTEMVFKRGVYLPQDASLKDLRNHFLDTDQLNKKNGLHFQFLNSDVPGDRIELDTEDEVLLCQIEDRLLQRRTMYIESIDSGLAMCELCVCGKFADLECTSCRKRGYCSQECQEKDWPSHEDFCREVSSRRERRRQRRQSRSQSGRRSSSRKATPMSPDTCVCGKEAEYECSGCNKQGYCSEECQREDWSFHEYYCNQPGNTTATRLLSHTPSNMQRGKLQTLFELPESSLEEQ